MKQGSYNFLFCAIISVLISTSSFAQNGLQAIEEITITSNSRQSEGMADINAAVSVIARDELTAIAHTHAQEALNRLPGVSIHRNNGRESLTATRSPVLQRTWMLGTAYSYMPHALAWPAPSVQAAF